MAGGVESIGVSWRWVADGGDEERAAEHGTEDSRYL